MITAVLVDDMKPALRELEFLLKKYLEISIIGIYTDPILAIEQIGFLKPEVVFLDINIPQLSGIDAASLIFKANPQTDIVFVTAYEEFAVKAFELSALDYLLKPVSPVRLEMSLEKLKKKHAEKAAAQASKGDQTLKIRCLGGFEVALQGSAPIKWRAEKTKELFAYLLHNIRRNISKDDILDALWRRDDPERAVRQLYNGVYYIRKALGDYGIDGSILSIDADYHLNTGDVEFDIHRFHTLHKQTEDRVEALECMEALYTGDYLGTLPYDWAAFERQHLLDMYTQCVTELSALYADSGRLDDAAAVLTKAYGFDPLSESVTKHLLALYRRTQNKCAAARHYSAYCALLKNELEIEPSESIRQLVDWF